MGSPVRVTHPVLHRFVPRRGTRERHGFATGRVDVEIAGFGERPRQVCAVDGAPVYAADGGAWERCAGTADSPAADEAELRRVLGAEGRYDLAGRTPLTDYLLRSPLCYSRVSGFHLARASSTGRGGEVRPDDVRTLVWDGSARAAADVRGFLGGNVRLHGGEVFLRYERVVLQHFELEGRLASRIARYPRADLGGASAALPGVDWATERNVAEHAGIPADLLRDDDATWFVNAFAHRLAGRLSVMSLDHRETGAAADARGRFVALSDGLGDLERRAWTSSVTGDRVAPALRLVAMALECLRDHSVARADSRDPVPGLWDTDRMEAGRYEHSVAVLRRRLLPRLLAAAPIVPEDAESLSALAR